MQDYACKNFYQNENCIALRSNMRVKIGVSKLIHCSFVGAYEASTQG
jgi:hypothetical protein